MAKDDINIKVQLESDLKKVVDATQSLKLDKGQTERFNKYSKGATLALDAEDLKGFQKNFNSLVQLFKEAAASTGEVSDEIKKLTDRQASLNQEINRLKDKKTTLESKLTSDGKQLTSQSRREFAATSEDAKQVFTNTGKQATDQEIIQLQSALRTFLEKTGKTINQVTNADLADIKTESGLSFKNRQSMFAANRYAQAETNYATNIQSDLTNITQDISLHEEEYNNLTNEINRLSQSAATGSKSINQLYTEISKLSGNTNKRITDEVNAQRLQNTDRSPGSQNPGSVDDLKTQKNIVGKAFKQFTLYTFALRMAKQALREAVNTVKELDKYLTEQAMVTGKTREETYALVGQYQELALACGATTKEIAQVSTEYMKQGKSISDALVLTEAAVKAAKVARVSVGDSVNYLTTALNGFQLEASEAMRVSDIFASVAAASATDYDELAIALSKVASQANLAGMSIEYTTALLTKGLETTREAPETMGTALKTIIARMREMSDYGETLEGDTDVNNVESQLAYVGIALKDQQGELRSTEEVLDELGRKWDELNKNQQAALARALAGTRQQSRLIALMDDYERVIELQEIAERSTGATSAQAGVYLEGMESALNQIQVAWEKIIMTVTDSELIIGFFEWIASALEGIAAFLSTDFGMVAALTLVATMSMVALQNKIQEINMQKMQNRLLLEAEKTKLKEIKAEKESRLLDIQAAKADLKKKKEMREHLKDNLKLGIIKAENNGDTAKAAKLQAQLNGMIANDAKYELEYQNQMNALTAEENILKAEISQTNLSIQSTSLKQMQNASGILGILMNLTPVLGIIIGLMQVWSTIQSIIIAKKKKSALATKAETKEETKKATVSIGSMFANVVSAFKSGGIPGIIAGIAIATALVAGLAAIIGVAALGISAAVGGMSQKSEADKASEEINSLSNEIYKLTERANAIANITSQFDALDDKVIKTKEDIQEMSSLLDSAVDSLSAENQKDANGNEIENSSQQAIYKNLQTDTERRKYLDIIEQETRQEANRYRQEQLKIINDLSASERAKILDDNTKNSSYLESQSAIRAIANNQIYETIDALKEEGVYTQAQLSYTEDLTTAIIAEVKAMDALYYANNPKKLAAMVNELNNLAATEIFMDDSGKFTERVQAFKDIQVALAGDRAALEALNTAYAEWQTFANMDQDVLQFLEDTELSIEKINQLYAGYSRLQKAGIEITKDSYHNALTGAMSELNADLSNLNEIIVTYFGNILSAGENFEKEWNSIILALSDALAVGMLDMGQNMEKFQNTINLFYEKSVEWADMKESEKMEFLSDYADLFSGEGGDQLLTAFESGDYNTIEAALAIQMEEKRLAQLAEVQRTLALELEKKGDERNAAYIRALQEYEAILLDEAKIYQASLELRLEQEEAQLEQYKEYLTKQQEALSESLDKRREAYEKYFNDINEIKEDEDYEEEATRLISNIAKLGSSLSGSAAEQRVQLEQELQELEEERLNTLRERAQEAVLENIDNTIDEINDKFDKLLESNQALLQAMTGELDNPLQFMTDMIISKSDDNLTLLEMENFLQELQGTYGSIIGNDVFDNMSVREENGQLILNIQGEEIMLGTDDQQSLYTAIMAALRAIGLR